MAMLAEPRRKQKWSVDPRNSTWSKDESKFGQKMLEKMGWSKGKGLGAQEQGSTEHIRVQLKNNTLGLGASNNHEDNWIAHQDDFNQLLAELNSHHGTGSAASSDGENKKSFSLEEKSKSSKKRVHYMKFAKGKDLSSRSDTDLACIFGKREKAKKSPKEETDSEPEEPEPNQSPSPTTEAEPGNTVTSSLSVNEYFAKRMAALKKSYGKCTESVTENVEREDNMEDYSEDTRKKSKKNLEQEDNMGDYSEYTKIKSKKNVEQEDNMEDYSEYTKKKSKKKKHRKNEDNNRSEEQEVEKDLQDKNGVDTTDCQERRRKSKNKTEEKDLTVDNSEEQEEDETIKKKKKKNKRKKELRDELQAEDVNSTPDEADQPKKKKKRKQKRAE